MTNTTATTTSNGSRRTKILADIAKIKAARTDGLPKLPDTLPGTTITATNRPEPLPCADDRDEEHDKLTPQERLQAFHIQHKAKELPDIEDTVDFLRMNVAKPKVLVKGLLHQGSKMIIGSGSKSYKTWTLLDLAMSVACGVPWLGLETTKGKVLYLNFELKPASIKSRIEAIKQDKGIDWGPWLL